MCKYRSFFWDCDPEGTNFAIHQPIQNQVLTFFRVNAVYQFISLAVLLILIRLPFLFTPLPLLIPELNWMLVGEQMSNGFLMYRDIWDNTSPLSAVVYWLVTSVFGRSQVAFQLVAMFFSITQAVYFNYMTNTRQLFTERNYVPGLVYVLFLNLSFDLCTLTPMLMSTTFLLLALGTVIKQMERQGVTDEVFEIGFYLGVATLFYLPSAIFIIWGAVSLIFFTGATFRQHSLMFLGFAFPVLVTGLVFYFSGGLGDLNRNLLASVFRVKQYKFNDFESLFVALFTPLVLGVLGLFKTFNFTRFVNIQTRSQQIMVLWLVVAFLSILLMPFLAPMLFVVFIPVLAFFTTNYFLLFKKKFWIAELIFTAATVTILVVFYQGNATNAADLGATHLQSLRVKPALLPTNIVQKKILVIGNDAGEYKDNQLATPYLNWNLAKYDLQNLDYYDSVISVLGHFNADPPEYIIDKENIVPQLMRRVPQLEAQYQPTTRKGIYKKINATPIKI